MGQHMYTFSSFLTRFHSVNLGPTPILLCWQYPLSKYRRLDDCNVLEEKKIIPVFFFLNYNILMKKLSFVSAIHSKLLTKVSYTSRPAVLTQVKTWTRSLDFPLIRNDINNEIPRWVNENRMFRGQHSWPKVSVLIANKETLLNMRKHDIHLFILQKTYFSSPQSDNTKQLRLYLSDPAIKSAKGGKGNQPFLSETAEFWFPPQILSVACLPTWYLHMCTYMCVVPTTHGYLHQWVPQWGERVKIQL